MNSPEEPYILITTNGPYVVYGEVPLTYELIEPEGENASGDWKQAKEFPLEAKMALCRCGHSKEAPYCDGTHREIGFDGTETAMDTLFKDVVKIWEGPRAQMEDAKPFCAFARFCNAGLDAWDGAEQADDDAAMAHLKRQVDNCPSGRLVLRDKATGETIETKLAKKIAVTQDPARECSGPLWVTGGITIRSQDGHEYEVRNRVTLCRCGASQNKPFCDGAHVDISYQDGAAE